MLKERRIVLGVTGGIAAYKVLELVRLLWKAGHEVQVVMTAHARKLIGPESFAALSGRPVAYDLFPRQRLESKIQNRKSKIEHVDLACWADLVLVAPATANFLGKLATGIADDLLSTILLAVPGTTLESGRVILAPAMNANMWLHPAVQENVAVLAKRGYVIASPDQGELACGTTGPGRLPEPLVLLDLCQAALAGKGALPDLTGLRVLVTAGRTEEPLDPVRIITNRSSGRMGIAICRQFVLARASVRLIAGPVSVPLPAGIAVAGVRTTEEMLGAVLKHLPEADVLVMCAAPADFRPARPSPGKRRDKKLMLELVRTPDILKAVSRTEHHALVVGFSLDPSAARARRKLEEKNLDLVVANDYSTPEADTIKPRLIYAKGRARVLPVMSKEEFGRRLVKEAAMMLERRRR
jgi:phosphopantothenoylcysteine decarboxylase/phosphopantothenate--cysteine ligase